MEPILSFENLTFRYPDPSGKGEVTALRDFSLAVGPGEAVAVVGESGSGKTTLSRLAAGILRGGEGSIRFDGRELSSLTRRDWKMMRRQVQVVFQSPAGSIRPRMKVGAFLREPLIHYRLCPRREVEAEVVRLLEKVGLPGSVRDRYPGELSGGELQRVTIARAVAVKPDLLICDEPTSALDPAVQTEIADLLHETAAETGAAMLLITHDLALASRLARRVAVLYKGRLLELLPAAELGRASHPYTRALLEAMFTLTGGGAAPPKGEETVPETAGCPYRGRCPMAEAACREKEPFLLPVEEGHLSACRKSI